MPVSAPLQAGYPSAHWGPVFPGLVCPRRVRLSQLCAHVPALCPQEPAFGMLAAPLRTPLTRLPAEYHSEAVGIFKLVRVCLDHLRIHSPCPRGQTARPLTLPSWTLYQPKP